MTSFCVHTLWNTIDVLPHLQSEPSCSRLVAYGNHGIPAISVHFYTVLNLEMLFYKYFHKCTHHGENDTGSIVKVFTDMHV
jgi:hypothetical protein